MTSDNHTSLSKYQRAILTHMGIVPWRMKSDATDVSSGIQEKNSPSQERREAGLEKLREVVSTDKTTSKHSPPITKQDFNLVEPSQGSEAFIRDVMQSIGLEADQGKILAEVVGDRLTTIRLDANDAAALKRQLWQILQNHISGT